MEVFMQPKQKDSQAMLFTSRLEQILNDRHPLYKLAKTIDWPEFDNVFGKLYDPGFGRPAKPTRLMVGLHYLKYTYNLSDEAVIEMWIENPYWQYFCGEQYFQHEFPIDPTSMTKWRNRIKGAGMEKLLEQTIIAGLKTGTLKQHQLKRLVSDTTVQEKVIAFPTDARLYQKMRLKLVKKAQAAGIELRQSYQRLAKMAFCLQHRFTHARQFKKAQRQLRKLRTYLGRVTRDIERKVSQMPQSCQGWPSPLQQEFSELLEMSHRLLSQKRDSKDKLYSLHAPEVNYISKGKAHKKYEFGCKVGLVSVAKNAFIVGSVAFEGNPYDGHTLKDCLSQTMRLLGKKRPDDVYVDDGCKGHGCSDIADVHIVRRGWRKLPASIRRWYSRRSMIEPVIGHCKQDNSLARNHLKVVEGDRVNSILSACVFNIRKLLRKILFLLLWIVCDRPLSAKQTMFLLAA
jgi:IS5 family transposase